MSTEALQRHKAKYADTWDPVLNVREGAIPRRTPQELEIAILEAEEDSTIMRRERDSYKKVNGCPVSSNHSPRYRVLSSAMNRKRAEIERNRGILASMESGEYLHRLERTIQSYGPGRKRDGLARLYQKQEQAIAEWKATKEARIRGPAKV